MNTFFRVDKMKKICEKVKITFFYGAILKIVKFDHAQKQRKNTSKN